MKPRMLHRALYDYSNDHRWQRAVGRFMLNFAELEAWSYIAISDLSSERVDVTKLGLGLSKRVDLILAILKNKNMADSSKKRLEPLLKEVKNLAEKRNLIAHHPLSIFGFEDKHGHVRRAILKKNGMGRYDVSDKGITIEEVEDSADRLKSIMIELNNVLSDMWGFA